jgi:hypothetical protein
LTLAMIFIIEFDLGGVFFADSDIRHNSY